MNWSCKLGFFYSVGRKKPSEKRDTEWEVRVPCDLEDRAGADPIITSFSHKAWGACWALDVWWRRSQESWIKKYFDHDAKMRCVVAVVMWVKPFASILFIVFDAYTAVSQVRDQSPSDYAAALPSAYKNRVQSFEGDNHRCYKSVPWTQTLVGERMISVFSGVTKWPAHTVILGPPISIYHRCTSLSWLMPTTSTRMLLWFASISAPKHNILTAW